MNINEVKNLVLVKFNDYHNTEKIKKLIEKYCTDINNEYDSKSNISKEIFCAMVIENKIYLELLHSEEKEDIDYIKNIFKRIENIIKVKREAKKEDVESLKDYNDAYIFCKNNYDGREMFIPYIGKYINSCYNGFEEELLKKNRKILLFLEKETLESLNKMYNCEKRLKLLL